jgi:hypothetical protein
MKENKENWDASPLGAKTMSTFHFLRAQFQVIAGGFIRSSRMKRPFKINKKSNFFFFVKRILKDPRKCPKMEGGVFGSRIKF